MLTREINDALLASYSEDIPTFLKNIYAARGVLESQLSLSLNGLLKPDFEQINIALDLLEKALFTQKRILIIGDFDCDGATASVVAVKSLRMMGGKYVDFLVPNRFEHGYGLSEEIVMLAIQEKQPDLIITVDNGISSFEGVKLAKSSGIKVIITDHHLPSKEVPEADAIINPNTKDCKFLSKNLAGVGVCFYLMSALKTHLLNQDYFTKHNIPNPDLRTVLDLVALGTVADVVKLDQNNRILVNEGIKRIRQKLCSVGILALLEIANRPAELLQASDLGFAVGPRLNAAGRLDDISFGIQCLLTSDMNDARRYASRLEAFNKDRKITQERIQDEAQAIVESQTIEQEQFAISVYDKSWHEGVVGIVAGKLKETYHCPSAVFAKSDATFIKGSIRSIADVHIKDLLDLVDRENPELIEKFGGHAMAAGLTIKEENFERFKSEFSKGIQAHLNNKLPKLELLTDGKLQAYDLTLANAQLITDNGPWGQGFEEPVFYGEFELIEQRVVGEKHLKCTLKLIGDSIMHDAIAFFQAPIDVNQVLVAYKLSVNTWRGNSNLQLMISKIKAL
ncbi:Single-stranded-DNA-specific exonuclease RecJ [uncultured Candidatus Thioglobus sp.]|nr:Single-stranded-DNA-specific exonuclease RecJ [uncultured Candidatus Thioglobus sp.]